MTWDKLIAEMDAKLAFPGMPNIWWMPIQTRTEMLSTGVRSPLGIEVFGDTPRRHRARRDRDRARRRDACPARAARSPIARPAASTSTSSSSATRPRGSASPSPTSTRSSRPRSAAMNVSETVEGRERYPINVRYAREFRDDPDAARQGARRFIIRIFHNVANEGPVYLQCVDREVLELGKRWIARAKIVQREPHTQVFDSAQHSDYTDRVMHYHAFGNFKLQQFWFHPGIFKRIFNILDQAVVHQLAYRQIYRHTDAGKTLALPGDILGAGRLSITHRPIGYDHAPFLRPPE